MMNMKGNKSGLDLNNLMSIQLQSQINSINLDLLVAAKNANDSMNQPEALEIDKLRRTINELGMPLNTTPNRFTFSECLVVPDGVRKVKRTFFDRMLSLTPWRAYKAVTKWKPDSRIYKTPYGYIAHPSMREAIESAASSNAGMLESSNKLWD